jgi:hypothetical protein
MPAKKHPVTTSLDTKVENFGFSVKSIRIMQNLFPKAKLPQLVRAFAKYLLSAESREEAKWQKLDKETIEHYFNQKVLFSRMKPVSFILPGAVCTPDFFYMLEDGTRVHCEVKGSVFAHGYKEAMVRVRAAASINWDLTFILVMPDKESYNGWSVEVIKPDENFIRILAELADSVEESIDGLEVTTKDN